MWICIALSRNNLASKALRYDTCYTIQGSRILPATKHEPYLPLLPSLRASPPFGRCSLRLPTEGWSGWVDLGGWLNAAEKRTPSSMLPLFTSDYTVAAALTERIDLQPSDVCGVRVCDETALCFVTVAPSNHGSGGRSRCVDVWSGRIMSSMAVIVIWYWYASLSTSVYCVVSVDCNVNMSNFMVLYQISSCK